jgi:hypothetical protein
VARQRRFPPSIHAKWRSRGRSGASSCPGGSPRSPSSCPSLSPKRRSRPSSFCLASHVVSYSEEDGTRCFFPIDPCDSIVEVLRLRAGRALHHRVH